LIPGSLDLTIYRGDDFLLDFTIHETNLDGSVGDPLDLTGWTVKAEVRVTVDTVGTALLTFTAVVDSDQSGNPGLVHITASNSLTAALGSGNIGVYDVQLTDPGSLKHTFLKGSVSVTPDVTKP
jgi:hypothetical protein